MKPTRTTPDAIRHDAAGRRFHVQLEGHVAELTYRMAGTDTMLIDHTGVPEAIGGRGIAGQLVAAAFEHAAAQDWKVIPACSYAAAWVDRHPEHAGRVQA